MTIPLKEEENTHNNKDQDEEALDEDLSITKVEIDPQQQEEQQDPNNQNNNNNNILVSEDEKNEEKTTKTSGGLKLLIFVLEGLSVVGMIAFFIVWLVRQTKSNDLQAQQQANLAWIQEVIVAEGVSRESDFSPYLFSTTGGGLDVERQFTPQARSAEWLAFGTDMDMTTDRQTVVQRYVLGVLYFSLQIGELEVRGEGEARKEVDLGDYLATGDECTWRSTDGSNRSYHTCDSSGAITSIYFDAKGKSGRIPSELSELRNSLSSIQFVGLNLQGSTIPTVLGRLTHIQSFTLLGGGGGGSGITGTSTKNGDQEVTNVTEIPPIIGVSWSQLEYLRLFDLDLHGTVPTQLGQLTQLRRMDLSRNQLTGVIPTELGNLSELTQLNLGQNDLEGEIPTELGVLAGLKLLRLFDNRLTGSLEFLCDEANVEADAAFHADLSLVECSCCACCEDPS